MKSGRFANSMRTRPQRQESFSIAVIYQEGRAPDSGRSASPNSGHQERRL
jgi:hypothetical protein